MKTLFTNIKKRIQKMIILPICMFVVSLFFLVAIKPNMFYSKAEGYINEFKTGYRTYNAGRGSVGSPLPVYEITIDGNKYEMPQYNELKKHNLSNIINKKATVLYETSLLHVYPDVVTLTIEGEKFVTNEHSLESWFFSLFFTLLSAAWLLWHFIRYWKRV